MATADLSPRALVYDSRQAFPAGRLLLLWLVVIAVPLGAFYGVIGMIQTRERTNALLQARKNLAEEMDRFREDLDPRVFVQQKLWKVDRHLGFRAFAPGSPHLKRVLPFSPSGLETLRRQVEKNLGGKLFGLFLHGPDTREVLYDFRPAGQRQTISRAEDLRDIFVYYNSQFDRPAVVHHDFSRELWNTYLVSRPIWFEHRAYNCLSRIFGGYATQKISDKTCLSFFSKEFGGGFFLGYYSLCYERGRDEALGNHRGYLAVLREEEIRPEMLLDWALKSQRQAGIQRLFLPARQVRRPEFIEAGDGVMFADVVPQTFLTYLRHVIPFSPRAKIYTKWLEGHPPAIAVFMPRSALLGHLSELLDGLRITTALLFALSVLLLVHSLLFGFEPPFRLGGKINLAIGYALLFPMIGLGGAVIFSLRFFDLVYPEEIMDALSRRLAIYVSGMDMMETYLGFRQNQLRDRLVANPPRAVNDIRTEVARWYLEGGNLENENFRPLEAAMAEKLSRRGKLRPEEVQEVKQEILQTLTPQRKQGKEADTMLAKLLANLSLDAVQGKIIGFEEVKQTLRDQVGQISAPRNVFCLLNTRLEYQGPDEAGTPGTDRSGGAFERGLVLEKLILMNGITGSMQEQERDKLKIVTMHSMIDSFLGFGWAGRFYMREGAFQHGPLSTVQYKFSGTTLYEPGRSTPSGMLFFRYFPMHVSWSFLNILRQGRGNFTEQLPGVRMDYAIFALPGRLTEDLMWEDWSDHPPGLGLMRKKAQEIMALRVNRRWNLLDSEEKALFVSRSYPAHPHVGVGRATLLERQSRARTVIPFLLAGFPVLLILVVSWVLRRSFVAPIEAFAALARAIGAGHLGARVAMRREDEIGRMGEALNEMAAGLQERERMTRFVSDEVVAAVAADQSESPAEAGELTEVTVLFAHLRDFAGLAEQHPPEVIVDLLNEYFTAMEEPIREQGGAIDKFIGDAVMAVFRTRPGREAHPIRACQAALGMRAALQAMNERRRERNQFGIDAGIGIASGDVISGRIGSETGRLDFTVIGNTVNLAARLEGESKKARIHNIILAPTTIHLLKGRARVAFIDRVDIKGRSRQFPLYELVGMR